MGLVPSMLSIEVVGYRSSRRLNRTWMNCVRKGICTKNVNTEIIADKKETCFANPSYLE